MKAIGRLDDFLWGEPAQVDLLDRYESCALSSGEGIPGFVDGSEATCAHLREDAITPVQERLIPGLTAVLFYGLCTNGTNAISRCVGISTPLAVHCVLPYRGRINIL